MTIYVSSAVQGAAAMPIYVMLTATVSIVFFDGINVLIWTMATLIGYALLAFIAKRASRQTITTEVAESLEMQFTTAHAIIGLGWSIFAFQSCTQCTGMDYSFYKGIVLLVAIAVTAM
ncbi:MAG: sensor histidine kinase, partial [Pseudomonadota bacterium]